MANKPVRQFKTHAAPAGARGYRARRPIRKLEGGGNTANPVQVGNAFVGKPSDDQGLKEHGEGAGGMLKTDTTIGVGGGNYTLGQLLYQQQLAAANQPPPLPQPSANIPYAVDPRDLGYVPQQPQPRLLPPTATTATIQPPLQRPVSRPAITTTNTPIGGGGFFPETPPEFVEATARPNVGVDITPEQFTLPPQQRTIRERPPVVDYGPITTPIERPTPIDIGYTEPEPIQVEPQPQLEEPRPTAHYGELPVPQDEITNLIDTILPETPYVGSEVPYVAPEIPYEGSEDIIESSADILAPQPLPPRTLDDPVVQQQDPVGGARAEDEFFMEDYHRGTDLGVGRGNIDEYVGSPIVGDPVGAAEIAEVLKPVRQQKEGPEFLVDPIVDDKEEFKGGPVTSNVQGETVEYDVDPRDFQDSRDLGQQQPEPPLVDRGGQATVEDTVVDTTGQEKTQTQAAATSPPVGGRKWLHTGDQDFAETRWQLFGAGQGDPIITDTPAVSGPQVNRETGEITTQPLTWWANQPAGSSVSPYTEGISTGTGTGAQGPPDITGVSPTSTTGGEGRTPFQTFLENQDNAGELIPGGLNLDAASLKGTAAINQLRSSYTAKDFEGVDSFEKLGNIFENKLGLENFGNGAANFIQELTGMQEGDLKGPGLWNTLNTPIPAFSTGEFGITPLDIITVAVGGLAAIGPVLMHKFMESALQPFTAAIGKGFKGVFDGIFNRGGQPTGDVAQSDINAADLAVLAEELGISKPAGTIAAGTYYGADGTVIARNMKPLDFGLNTVDGANSFKDVLNNTATKVDPNYETVYYDTKTGQIDVVHADGSVTESASHITVDSDGNMQQGKGKSKKTKKVNWGVNVIGVESIDTVAPRKDKGKGKGKGGKSIFDWIKDILGSGEDEDDEEDTPPSGN